MARGSRVSLLRSWERLLILSDMFLIRCQNCDSDLVLLDGKIVESHNKSVCRYASLDVFFMFNCSIDDLLGIVHSAANLNDLN